MTVLCLLSASMHYYVSLLKAWWFWMCVLSYNMLVILLMTLCTVHTVYQSSLMHTPLAKVDVMVSLVYTALFKF